MAKKKKPVEINRKEYDRIRKMDRNSMQEHIAGYYDRGYAAGIEAGRQQAANSLKKYKEDKKHMEITRKRTEDAS